MAATLSPHRAWVRADGPSTSASRPASIITGPSWRGGDGKLGVGKWSTGTDGMAVPTGRAGNRFGSGIALPATTTLPSGNVARALPYS